MKLYPAIDLKDGKCVRLYKGDIMAATVYNDNALVQATSFQKMGFSYLHVVDLNGAMSGKLVNKAIVERILKVVTIPVQLGGGIRDRATVEAWLAAGVARVILGTTALNDPQLVRDLARENPEKIVVGIDARDGLVAVEGWVKGSRTNFIDLARKFEDAGVAAIIYTDIGRDGTLSGPNIESTLQLAKAVSIPVILSGGIKTNADIAQLITHKEIDGAIIGRALYEKTFDIRTALDLCLKGSSFSQPMKSTTPVSESW